MIDTETAELSGNRVEAKPQTDRDQSTARRTRWPKATFALVALGVVAFNIWWYWRETRPVPGLAAIAGWLGSRRYAEAEPALREHLRRSPEAGDARTMLARLLAARGDSRGCARELHRVPDWWPTKAEATYREGQTYLIVDRARDAEAAWMAIITADPLHPAPPAIFQDASVELLKLYATEDRWEDAPRVIWDAYDRAGPEDRSLLLIMRMRSELERVAPSEAMVRLKRYVAADPEDGEALRALARAELALGRSDDAAQHFQACLARHPNDSRAWRDYLAMLLERGQMEEFATMLARVPAAAETEPQIWFFRGVAREKQGDLEGAVRLFREALARNPFTMEYHYRCALVEDRLGRRDDAASHRKRSQQLRAARTELHQFFGDYLDIVNHRPTLSPRDLPATIKRLASICEMLGWVRAAEGWTEELSRTERESRE